MDSEVSLRPLSLKPGGGKANPFAGFGKGAGAGIKKQVTDQPSRSHRLALGLPCRDSSPAACCETCAAIPAM